MGFNYLLQLHTEISTMEMTICCRLKQSSGANPRESPHSGTSTGDSDP